MDKTRFIERLIAQFENPEEVTLEMDSDFRQIESYDSLTGMTIMVMLKDDYDVDITDDEYISKKTVQELYDFVLLKKK